MCVLEQSMMHLPAGAPKNETQNSPVDLSCPSELNSSRMNWSVNKPKISGHLERTRERKSERARERKRERARERENFPLLSPVRQ